MTTSDLSLFRPPAFPCPSVLLCGVLCLGLLEVRGAAPEATAGGQGESVARRAKWQLLAPGPATEAAFRYEARRQLLAEANCVARQLGLSDNLPITESNSWSYIIPYPHARGSGAIGTVSTRDYTYSVANGYKFTHLTGRHQSEDLQRWKADYAWPIRQMDTNAAYAMATQWLNAISIDVPALNRDLRLEIRAARPYRGLHSGRFLPLYTVVWWDPKGIARGASVTFLEPTKRITQLDVDDPKYVLRPPLHFTNLDRLLPDEAAARVEAYASQARRLLVAEAQSVAHQLHLAEKLPMAEADLKGIYVSPLDLFRATQDVGLVETANYSYSVGEARKFSEVRARRTGKDFERWAVGLAAPSRGMDTNAAYQLATQWLAAVSMDVEALNRDFRVQIDSPQPRSARGGALSDYTVYWIEGESMYTRPVAAVSIFAPNKTLMCLRVGDPKYILRAPLQFTNLQTLLSGDEEPVSGR